MNDLDNVMFMRAAVGDKRIPYAIEQWMPGAGVLTEHAIAYVASPGTETRDIQCMVCGKPAGGTPFVMLTITYGQVCGKQPVHFLAATVIRHTECPVTDPDTFAEHVMRMLSQCADG